MAIAIVVLIVFVVAYFVLTGPEPPADESVEPIEDVATPYLEGLEASFRIQQAAWIAEQQMYAEAARYREIESQDARTER
jgi:hypothetical protein